MHIGAGLREWRIGVGMGNIFARKQWNGAISTMNILLCSRVLVADILSMQFYLTYPVFLLFPVIKLLDS